MPTPINPPPLRTEILHLMKPPLSAAGAKTSEGPHLNTDIFQEIWITDADGNPALSCVALKPLPPILEDLGSESGKAFSVQLTQLTIPRGMTRISVAELESGDYPRHAGLAAPHRQLVHQDENAYSYMTTLIFNVKQHPDPDAVEETGVADLPPANPPSALWNLRIEDFCDDEAHIPASALERYFPCWPSNGPFPSFGEDNACAKPLRPSGRLTTAKEQSLASLTDDGDDDFLIAVWDAESIASCKPGLVKKLRWRYFGEGYRSVPMVAVYTPNHTIFWIPLIAPLQLWSPWKCFKYLLDKLVAYRPVYLDGPNIFIAKLNDRPWFNI